MSLGVPSQSNYQDIKCYAWDSTEAIMVSPYNINFVSLNKTELQRNHRWHYFSDKQQEMENGMLHGNIKLQCNKGSKLFIVRKYLVKRSLGFRKTILMMTSSNGNIFRVTGSLCGEFTGPGEFPTQRPVTRSFDVFFDLRLNKRLSKQPWGWWFETISWSLWRLCDARSQSHRQCPIQQAVWVYVPIFKESFLHMY